MSLAAYIYISCDNPGLKAWIIQNFFTTDISFEAQFEMVTFVTCFFSPHTAVKIFLVAVLSLCLNLL